jgi:serine/threonine protein kinase/Tol biopolymer transport system component
MTLGQGNLLNNRYRVIEILGRGGMGAVYHAVDESLGVDVAVKENLFTTDDYARQFRMEAVILAGIRHPNLPRVTDHFVIDAMGQYLVMDYIDGYDLRQHMEKEGPISEEEAIRVGAAACDALSYLHSRKPPILHRDIKLGNIKISTDGQVYLVDFGLAKMGWEHEETMTGARAMTPGYSPPEQYGSARTDARSDIYSLGATLYAALTGIIPEDSLIRAVDGVNLTPLREHRPEISQRLAGVIEKALETSSTNRYQSAEAFKWALLGQPEPPPGAEKSEAVPLPPLHTPARKTRKRASSFWRVLGFFMLLLLIVGGAIWLSPFNQDIFRAGFLPLPDFLATVTPAPLPSSSPQAVAPVLPQASRTPTPAASFTATSTTKPTLTPSKTVTATSISVASSTYTLTPANTTSATPDLPTTATSGPTAETTAPTPSALPPVIPQPTLTGGAPGEIAFATTINHISQIYLLNADGTNLHRLTSLPKGACSFAWSPDGKQIVFVSPCSDKASLYPKSSLYLLNIETGKTTPLDYEPGGDFEPTWSPDGTKIAFTSLRDHSLQIYVLNLSDSSLTRLTPPGDNAQARYPAWSPDSSQILYTAMRFGLLQIWSMSADGSNKQQLVRTGGTMSEYLPAWSPDGDSLFFSETNSGLTSPSALARFDIHSNKFSLLSIPRPVVDIDISPDGQWIAYETTDTINQDIFIYHLGEAAPQRLTTSPDIDFDPAWRPAQ